MELKKKFKKIGFIFGLKREMKLVSHKNNNIICVYGYGKASKNATKKLIKFGVDIVINFGFAGSVSKSLKNDFLFYSTTDKNVFLFVCSKEIIVQTTR